MRVLICGGRNFAERDVLFTLLDRIKDADLMICNGGAPGADSLSTKWAEQEKVPHFVFHAKWNTYGKSAGPIRNQKMIDEFKPQLVIAFPGNTGTTDMIRKARKARIPVVEVRCETSK